MIEFEVVWFHFILLYFIGMVALSFAGELEVASAKNVVLYTTLSHKSQDRENGLCGLLVVTNFKLSFLTSNNDQVCYIFLMKYQINCDKFL